MRGQNKKKAVFLDRDGIINKEKYFIKSWKEFEFVPSIFENIKKLKKAGFLVIVITNQSGVKRGYFTEETLKQIHKNMKKVLEKNEAQIDDIFYCPHYNDDNCDCRKPKPGMILKAAEKYNIDLKQSWVIGDTPRDIEAGEQAGCNTILVKENTNIKQHIEKIIKKKIKEKNILICGLPNTVLRIFIENLKENYNIFFISYSKTLQYSKIKEKLGENTFLIEIPSTNLLKKIFTIFRLLTTSFKIGANKNTQVFVANHNHFIKNGLVMLMMKWCFPKIKRVYFPYDIIHYLLPKKERNKYRENWIKSQLPFFFDKICFENCDKIITKGFEGELKYLKEVYNIENKPHYVFNHLIEGADVVNKNISQLNKDKVNLVYIGGISSSKLTNHIEVIKELINEKKIILHIYSHNASILDDLKNNKNLIIHDYVDQHKDLINKISKYDFGFLLSKPPEYDYLQQKMASTMKIYDYLAANLPIITNSEHEFRANMVKSNNLGIVIPLSDIKNVIKYIEKSDYKSLLSSVKKQREQYLVSKENRELEKFINNT
jgi:D,D-heptose 1,7-bisphosphate phosphatase